jgi:large subunit ribosomal protein L5
MANNFKVIKARLQEEYATKYRAELQKELQLASVMQVPVLKKIVINIGAGRAISDPKILDGIVTEVGMITGQQAVKTKARKSIAAFNLREHMPIGVMVILRGRIMYEFLDRLINVALPRVRDFNGVNGKSFDANGNYSFAIKEQIIFPEINVDQVSSIHGMDITFNIKSSDIEHSRSLLKKFNFPFRK